MIKLSVSVKYGNFVCSCCHAVNVTRQLVVISIESGEKQLEYHENNSNLSQTSSISTNNTPTVNRHHHTK